MLWGFRGRGWKDWDPRLDTPILQYQQYQQSDMLLYVGDLNAISCHSAYVTIRLKIFFV